MNTSTKQEPKTHKSRIFKPNRKLSKEIEKLQASLCRRVGQTMTDYSMIEEGDKVMVYLSWGKDSYGLLDMLLAIRPRAPIHFDIVAVNLDQKQPGFPAHVLPDYLTKLNIPFHIEEQDIYSTVKRIIPKGETMCSLCSRLRRGILYRLADELGSTKIALGHLFARIRNQTTALKRNNQNRIFCSGVCE